MNQMKTAAFAALIAAMSALPALADEGKIVVTGEGRVDSAPDLATISVGVSTQAATAAEALSANNAKLATVLERLKTSGVEGRDLQTSGLSLGPRIEYNSATNQPKVVNYEASNMLTVRVRELSALGTILDQTVADGANVFNGLEFSLADPQPALDEARKLAVKDARRKAEMMAEAAGVKLGKLMTLDEGGRDRPVPMMRMQAVAASAEAVPVAEGEVSYTVSVTAVWEIKEN